MCIAGSHGRPYNGVRVTARFVPQKHIVEQDHRNICQTGQSRDGMRAHSTQLWRSPTRLRSPNFKILWTLKQYAIAFYLN